MIHRLLAAALFTTALSASAQSTPAANFTDFWWNPAESGWGLSIAHHAGTNQVFVAWYTYDPREPLGNGQSRPLWIVMPGGNWVTPNTLTGAAYVANGVPFNVAGSNSHTSPVGTFTFTFSSPGSGQFSYNIAAPAGLPPSDPAFNLPEFSGTRDIVRQSF